MNTAQGGAIDRLARAIDAADAVVVGAGSGLSASAGFTYSGERFERLFAPWQARYGFTDMYAGGFYPFPTLEEFWGFWSRNIMANRYADPPRPTYDTLASILQGRDHFVITTNVDHCFQKVDVDKRRLFYTQGDYGLWQCSQPCHRKTYDNEKAVRAMAGALDAHVAAQRAASVANDELDLAVPTEMVPRCPVCGAPMSMNLRCDDTFVEDDGWHAAAARYREFLRRHEGMRTVFLELGVGRNTPGIIKYPFWRMTDDNPKATYAVVNLGEARCPREIAEQAVCVDADIDWALGELRRRLGGR